MTGLPKYLLIALVLFVGCKSQNASQLHVGTVVSNDAQLAGADFSNSRVRVRNSDSEIFHHDMYIELIDIEPVLGQKSLIGRTKSLQGDLLLGTFMGAESDVGVLVVQENDLVFFPKFNGRLKVEDRQFYLNSNKVHEAAHRLGVGQRIGLVARIHNSQKLYRGFESVEFRSSGHSEVKKGWWSKQEHQKLLDWGVDFLYDDIKTMILRPYVNDVLDHGSEEMIRVRYRASEKVIIEQADSRHKLNELLRNPSGMQIDWVLPKGASVEPGNHQTKLFLISDQNQIVGEKSLASSTVKETHPNYPSKFSMFLGRDILETILIEDFLQLALVHEGVDGQIVRKSPMFTLDDLVASKGRLEDNRGWPLLIRLTH